MTNLQASRTRTITWEDPTAAVQTGKLISGIAYLKALQTGELPPPPIAVLLDMSITEVNEGRVIFVAEPAEQAIPLWNSRSTTCAPLQLKREQYMPKERSFTLEDA